MGKYSEKLINEVERVFPGRKDMLELAIRGEKSLGDLLCASCLSFPYKIVFECLGKDDKFNEIRFQRLANICKIEHDKYELYLLWCNELSAFRKKLFQDELNNKQPSHLVYSKEFISKIKSVYSDNKVITYYAENGLYPLGKLLYDKSTKSFDIIYKIMSNNAKTKMQMFDEIMLTAKTAEARSNLYSMWCKEEGIDNQLTM